MYCDQLLHLASLFLSMALMGYLVGSMLERALRYFNDHLGDDDNI